MFKDIYSNIEQQIFINELQVSNVELQVSNIELQLFNVELRAFNVKLRAFNVGNKIFFLSIIQKSFLRCVTYWTGLELHQPMFSMSTHFLDLLLSVPRHVD